MSVGLKRSSGNRITRQAVADGLRRQIVAGRYPPGVRLPSREALVKTSGASYVTVQCGLTQLGEEGFVVSRHGDGTYVAAHPPHLCHYGMLMSRSEQDIRKAGNSRFARVLLEEAERFNQQQRVRQVLVWFDPLEQVNRPELAEVVERARLRRLAGLILINHPAPHLVASPLFADPGFPRVTASPEYRNDLKMKHVCPSLHGFLDQALKYLASAGRQRVAVLTTEVTHALLHRSLMETASVLGLVTKPFWTIPLQPRLSEGIRATVRLLYDRPQADRPDGLIIADDHMIESAVDGLYDAGVDTQRDVTVVGYCNFPDRPASKLPIVRIGTDCRELLGQLIESIDRQIRGEPAPAERWVEPVSEAQFNERYADA